MTSGIAIFATVLCVLSAVVIIRRALDRSRTGAGVVPWVTTFLLGAGLLASALMSPGSHRVAITGVLAVAALGSLGIEITTRFARK